jgi:putative endonuclease
MRYERAGVYLLTNERRTVLYTGVSNDIVRRVYEHRCSSDPGAFTARYRAYRLVYFELIPDMCNAIAREKQIKGWVRRKKIALIERGNPGWHDLWPDLTR